jgi:hypothetical protein
MNGHDQDRALACSRANDTAARMIVYFGPYLFWGTLGVVTTGLFLLG